MYAVFAKAEVTQKIADKEIQFAALICDVQEHLRDCPEKVIESIKSFLTTLTVGIQEDTSPCVFLYHQAEIIAHNKLSQVFQWLTLHGFWSFLNFYLLEKIVDKYGTDDDLKKRIGAFKHDMEKFKLEMKLVDFLPAWSGRCPHIPAAGFEPIILRVNKDWPQCTLADIAKMEGYLESRFLINRFILRLANGRYGSVVIMWLVPSQAIAYLKERIMAVGTKSLREEGIIEVMLGENFVMKVNLKNTNHDKFDAYYNVYLGHFNWYSPRSIFLHERK